MKAVEFLVKANDGIIKIPNEYNEFANSELRVILLSEEEKVEEIKTRKIRIKEAFEEIATMRVFDKISDPVQWQKNLRDDWE